MFVQNMPSISGDRGDRALCAGCGGKISDRYYLLAVDKQWHMRCLKCCECKLNLESELTCFSKDGSIYCKEDYYRWASSILRHFLRLEWRFRLWINNINVYLSPEHAFVCRLYFGVVIIHFNNAETTQHVFIAGIKEKKPKCNIFFFLLMSAKT